MANTSDVSLSYAPETTPGQPDASASRKKLRFTSEAFESTVDVAQDPEIREFDQYSKQVVLLSRAHAGEVQTEFSAFNVDGLLEGLFANVWSIPLRDPADFLMYVESDAITVNGFGVFDGMAENGSVADYVHAGDYILITGGEAGGYALNDGIKLVEMVETGMSEYDYLTSPYFRVAGVPDCDFELTALATDTDTNEPDDSFAGTYYLNALPGLTVNSSGRFRANRPFDGPLFQVPDTLFPGSLIFVDGFTEPGELANNGFKVVQNVRTRQSGRRIDITIEGINGRDFVPTGAVRNNVRIRPVSRLLSGRIVKYFTMRKQLRNVLQYYTGCLVERLLLEVAANRKCTASLSLLGLGHRQSTTELLSAAEEQPAAESNLVGPADVRLKVFPLSAAIATSATIEIVRQAEEQYGLSSLNPYDIGCRPLVVRGTFSLYLTDDGGYYESFLRNDSVRVLVVVDKGLESYAFDFPTARLVSGRVVAGGIGQDLLADFEFAGTVRDPDTLGPTVNRLFGQHVRGLPMPLDRSTTFLDTRSQLNYFINPPIPADTWLYAIQEITDGEDVVATSHFDFSLRDDSGNVVFSSTDSTTGGNLEVFGFPRTDNRFLLESEVSKLRLDGASLVDMTFRFRIEQVAAINSPLPFDQRGVLYQSSRLDYDQEIASGSWLYVTREITNVEDENVEGLARYQFTLLDSTGNSIRSGSSGRVNPRTDDRFLLESEVSKVRLDGSTSNGMNFRFIIEQVAAINSPLPFEQSGVLYINSVLDYDQEIASGTTVTAVIEVPGGTGGPSDSFSVDLLTDSGTSVHTFEFTQTVMITETIELSDDVAIVRVHGSANDALPFLVRISEA